MILLFLFSLLFSPTNVFSKNSFTFNQAGYIFFTHPNQTLYSTSNREKMRLDRLIETSSKSSLADLTLIDEYKKLMKRSVLLNRISRGSKNAKLAQTKANDLFFKLIAHLQDLQIANPEIFSKFKNSAEYNLNWKQVNYLPSYCKNYPSLKDGDANDYYSGQGIDKQERLYTTCKRGNIFSVTLDSLIQNTDDVLSTNYKNQALLVKEHLLKMVSNRIIKNIRKYDNIGNSNTIDFTKNKKLLSCLNHSKKVFPSYSSDIKKNILKPVSISKKKQKENLANQFDTLHAQNAIKAQALLDIKKQFEEDKKRELKDLIDRNTFIAMSCRASGNKPEKCKKRTKKIFDITKKYRDQTLKIDSQLELILKQTPTILKIENDPIYTKLKLVNVQINSSELLTTYSSVSKKGKNLVNKIKKNILKSIDKPSLTFLETDSKTKNELNDYISDVKKSKVVDEARKKEILNYTQSLARDLENICETKGEDLYHNKKLMDDMFNNIAQRNVSDSSSKINILKAQAGYCSILRHDPPNKDRKGLVYRKGMIAIVAGIGISFTGLGAVPGAALIATGGSMLAVGSYKRYQTAKLTNKNTLALRSTSWSSVRQLIDDRTRLSDAKVDVIINSAGLALDLIGVGLVTSSAKLASSTVRAKRVEYTHKLKAGLGRNKYSELILKALKDKNTPFLKGVTSAAQIRPKLFKTLAEAIKKGELYGHKLSPKEIESLKHEQDILRAVSDNPSLLKELKKNGFDIKNYLQGTFQSDLGKLEPYRKLLLEKSAKSDLLLDFLKGAGPPESVNALKEVLDEMGHKGFLLNSKLSNNDIRKIFSNNQILTGYLHEFPGMSEAVLAFQKGLITKADFKKQLAANLFHNGPAEGFWKLLEDTYIPGATGALKQRSRLADLFRGSVFDKNINNASVLTPSYGKPHSFESFVGTFYDRMSQGTRGGYRKIDAEILGGPLDNIINLGGSFGIKNTRAQVAKLQKLAKSAKHLTKSQKKIISEMARSGMEYLDKYLARSHESLILAKDSNGQVLRAQRAGPKILKYVPRLSFRHLDEPGKVTTFIRNKDGSYIIKIKLNDKIISSERIPPENAHSKIREIYGEHIRLDEEIHGNPMTSLDFHF